MKCVFSRQTICGKERKKEREEEGWGVGGGGLEMKVASVTSQRKYFTRVLLTSIHHTG